jgi:very-short-patch-repair endonuclease
VFNHDPYQLRNPERHPPPDDASALDWLLFDQHSVISRAQALDHLTAPALLHLVQSGRWQRPVPGVFVAHSGPLDREQILFAACLSTGPFAVLAGPTAAQAGGLSLREPAAIHLLVPATRRPERQWRRGNSSLPHVLVHRTTSLPAREVVRMARPRRTTMARSLVDAAQWARTDDEARALVAAGCQQRLVIAAEILDVVERMPRARRRALVLDTARMVADGATSLPEIDFAMLCRRAGLPLPDRQVERRDARGRRRYLDVYWAAFRLHVEIDGAWHTEVRAWWADMRRQNDLWIAGDRVLRFPAWLVRTRPAEVAAQVRAALVAAGWRP